MVLESINTAPSQSGSSRRKTQPHSGLANNLYVSYSVRFAMASGYQAKASQRRSMIVAPPGEPCHREQRVLWETSSSGGDIPHAFRPRCRGQQQKTNGRKRYCFACTASFAPARLRAVLLPSATNADNDYLAGGLVNENAS